MNEYIKSDLYRYRGTCGAGAFWQAFYDIPAFRHMVCVRLAAEKGLTKIIGKILFRIFKSNNIGITYVNKIGYGLFIGHNAPIVVHPSVVIGNNVNLSQFTTIGANHGKAAVIGDNTYIGPNVYIVEDVKIGNNVTIGAGSVVTKDIPDNATAAGNYAKVLNFNNPGRYILNPWKCPIHK